MHAGRTVWLACLALSGAAACGGGDDPTEPVRTAGSISFSYSGAESGSFDVTGVPGPSSDGATGARYEGTPNLLIVVGSRALGATHQDFIQLWLPGVTAPRTISLDDRQCLLTATDCPLAVFGRNMPRAPPAPGTVPEGFYIFTDGTVTVTTVNAGRIAGTFQGTAETLTLEEEPLVITITNGKFDVPLRSLDGT